MVEPEVGHSKHLRAVLRAARERMNLTQQEVAERITEMLALERPLSSSSVSEWERFGRHPAVNVMSAWARVVGLRLVVDLDSSRGERIPVMLRPAASELARAIDLLSDEDRDLVRQMVSRMKPRPDLV